MQCRLYRAASLLALLVAAALLAPPPSNAQYFGRNKVQYEDFDFETFTTDHFKVYFYPEEALATKDAGRMAERWYARHAHTFDHSYAQKPLIFYANDADFQQTNVIEGFISQGTGGVTEAMQNRVVMPLTGIYRETDHVLGHELIHTFQYDIAQNAVEGGMRGLGRLPLWLVEGMAEYLTVGRDDPHTAMWIRDALMRDDLPTIEDLATPEFFPYRYGQAYMAFIGGHWGDRAVARLFRLAVETSLDSALTAVTGLDSDSLSALWQAEVRAQYAPTLEGRVPPTEAGTPVLAPDIDAGEMNLAPAVSPDGRYVAFLSERDLFSINLFLADAQTGEVIEELAASDGDPHFDALRFINSAGAWSPDGERFAYVVFAEGDNHLNILDVDAEDVERRIDVEDVGAIANPAWSPDGRYLAFAGIEGGISDLYLYDFETRTVRQLTDDRYADLQPDWSPDGRTLAFVTDRGPGGTDFDNLSYADMRLGFYELDSDDVRVAVPFEGAKHINPQFSPDGRSLYFISDRSGVSDVYRMELVSGELFQVTNVATGITGITALAPALSVADQSGLMMYSVFSDDQYRVYSRALAETRGEPVGVEPARGVALAGVLPPPQAGRDVGLVGQYLRDPNTGLPRYASVDVDDYTPSLRLSYVGTPTAGIGYSSQFGAGIGGGVSFLFSDVLGNHMLGTSIQAQGSFKDIGGEVFYLNRDDQFNYGVQLSHKPYLTGSTFASQNPETGVVTYEQMTRRIFFTGGTLMGQYPFSTTRRFELQGGYQHIGYDLDRETIVVSPGGDVIDRTREGDIPSPDGLHLVSGSAALVGDYSSFGFVSPVQGGRWRLEAGYTSGSFSYGTLLADYRRYLFLRPLTVAFNAYHYGRYGQDADFQNRRFYPLNLGYSMYNTRGVHGYGMGTFDIEECRGGFENCPAMDRVIGTRVAIAAAELRYPFIGADRFGLINFPYLPTELVLFGDAGLAWTGDRAPELAFERRSAKDNIPVFSTGAAARMNLLGYVVLEAYYVYPFQRPDKGWFWGFSLTPGW